MDIGIVFGSAGAFKLMNAALNRLTVPAAARRNTWRWRNIFTSLIHSMLTGVWAVFCFYQHPEMAEDLISTHSALSHTLVSVSTGYFIHDFMDNVLNQKLSAGWEVLCHHFVVVTCFSIAVLTRQYVGFAVVALLVEINSVFLHGRQLLRMSGRAASSGALCRLNSVLNLGTFVAFRISTLAWMTRWLALNRTRVLLPLYAVGSVGLLAIMVMNAVLFYRLLRSDFLQAGREGTRKEK
ncbi:TLC domain-containing protein 2-like isoform X1 [Alosa sapidissima]|uniref:TLC domain-containing protein 2-like isoform X1 n=1 Tax=Alosa sapidissima TaxID=34773 RepID=UPI001C084A26|nr:TLC domain-containing protein 2-like isoform X1 [Alosa sapidissima]